MNTGKIHNTKANSEITYISTTSSRCNYVPYNKINTVQQMRCLEVENAGQWGKTTGTRAEQTAGEDPLIFIATSLKSVIMWSIFRFAEIDRCSKTISLWFLPLPVVFTLTNLRKETAWSFRIVDGWNEARPEFSSFSTYPKVKGDPVYLDIIITHVFFYMHFSFMAHTFLFKVSPLILKETFSLSNLFLYEEIQKRHHDCQAQSKL